MNNKVPITMYTTSWCSDCHRAKYFMDTYGFEYVQIDVEENPAGLAFVQKVNEGRSSVPTIVFGDGSILVEPSFAELAEKMGVVLDRHA